jgi:hypothetical protein
MHGQRPKGEVAKFKNNQGTSTAAKQHYIAEPARRIDGPNRKSRLHDINGSFLASRLQDSAYGRPAAGALAHRDLFPASLRNPVTQK